MFEKTTTQKRHPMPKKISAKDVAKGENWKLSENEKIPPFLPTRDRSCCRAAHYTLAIPTPSPMMTQWVSSSVGNSFSLRRNNQAINPWSCTKLLKIPSSGIERASSESVCLCWWKIIPPLSIKLLVREMRAEASCLRLRKMLFSIVWRFFPLCCASHCLVLGPYAIISPASLFLF